MFGQSPTDKGGVLIPAVKFHHFSGAKNPRTDVLKRVRTVNYCWINLLSLVLCEEKAMAPHSSTLAWKIPRMEEPGRLQSMGSLRVGHD